MKILAKVCFSLVFACQSLLMTAVEAAGSFEPVIGSPFTAGNAPATSAFSPVVSGNLFTAIPNYDDNTISVYLVDQTTGALNEVAGSPFATGSQPAWQAYSPLVSGNLFSAVANYNDNTVSVYSVDQTTGAFTEIAGSPFHTGVGPYSIQFSPLTSGNLFASIANSEDNTISVYSVDQSTGAFTEVFGSPFASGSGPYIATFSPVVSGNLFAAVANYNDNTVSVFDVDQTSGTFTEIVGSPFTTGTNPYNVQFSPIASGNLFAAVVNLGSNDVSVFEVDQTSGAFSEIASSPVTAGAGANQIAYSSIIGENLFAAVVNFNDNTVSVYQVDQTTGALNEVDGSPFTTGGGPDGIAFSSLVSGNLFADVANFFDNTVSVYQVSLLPTVASISPSNGPLTGSTYVTITGTNFTGATSVDFGGTSAVYFNVVSDTQINAVSPPGLGTVDITVTTPQGTSDISSADLFDYVICTRCWDPIF